MKKLTFLNQLINYDRDNIPHNLIFSRNNNFTKRKLINLIWWKKENYANVEKAKKIIKLLSSKKYKRKFYYFVSYGGHNSKISFLLSMKNVLIKTTKNIKRILINLKHYKTIRKYVGWNNRYIKLNEQINKYFNETTYEQRLDRAIELKLINENIKKTNESDSDRTIDVISHKMKS
jgi:hypothetical protein